jgi:hypothetical protein
VTQILVPAHGVMRIPADPHLPDEPIVMSLEDPHFTFLVEFFPDAPVDNPRASRILAELTDVHAVLRGDVLFTQLDADTLRSIIELG